MAIKVLELKGFKSYRALCAFHTLMLGLKMLPDYMNEGYEEFYDRLSKMPAEDQKKMIDEAVKLVPLDSEEVEALMSFACDNNGVPYSKVNIDNLNPLQINENLSAVCVEISKIKIDFVSESEKKN